MIGKTVKGNGFGGVLRYLLEKPEAEYIGGNMAATTPKGLAREFRAIASHNTRVLHPVAHISLSPSPDEELSDSKALEFTQAYMEKIGFSNCQWILVKHSDTITDNGKPRPHFHIVANRVQQTDYKVITAWRDYRRSEIAIRELEKEFGLIQVQPSWEFDSIASSTGQQQKAKREKSVELAVHTRLQEIIDTVASSHPTMPQFLQKLKQLGVEAKVHFQSTGRIQGITYEMNSITFSGTKLGKAYTFNGVQKYRGVTYNPERDLELIKVKEKELIAHTPPVVTPNIQAYGKPKKRRDGLELE